MTIGIGVVLPNAVLLLSDGRQRTPLNLEIPPNDDARKITILNDSLAAIEIGLSQATIPAIKTIEKIARPDLDTEDISKILDASIIIGWNIYLAALSTTIDTTHKAFRSALIIGGYTPSECFIGGVLHGTDIHDGPMIMANNFDFLILGGEENNSRSLLEGRLNEIKAEWVNKARWPSEKQYSKLYNDVLNTAAETIRDLESDYVGGTIRYVLFRPNCETLHGIWSRERWWLRIKEGVSFFLRNRGRRRTNNKETG